MSFASEPGRDDGGLPPVNIVVPDDARDLDRDVLAYRRELRARRRRQRLTRFIRPLRSAPGFSRHAALIPLIAVCLAVALVGGAILSVVTMSPAAAPTLSSPQRGTRPPEVAALPTTGNVLLDRGPVAVRTLVTSAIALVPAGCDCGIGLRRLAGQAADAHVPLYFSGATQPITELDVLAVRYGNGVAAAAADRDGVLTKAYHPSGLTVLLVFKDATAEVFRDLPVTFELSPTMHRLRQPSTVLGA